MAIPFKKIRLGELLVKNGVITREQLEKALAWQKKSNDRLGKVLVEHGIIPEPTLLNFLSQQLHIPYVNLAQYNFDRQLVQRLPEPMARRFRAIPLKDLGDRILIGMADPTDVFAIDEIARHLGKPVEPAVVSERLLMELLPRLYGAGERITDLTQALQREVPPAIPEAVAEEAPVMRFIQALFRDAVNLRASDIHIEPGEKVLRVRLRIDGVLHEHLTADVAIASTVITRIKLQANMDISEHRLPQDGRFPMNIEGKALDVRVSTLPTLYGESVVMRLLDQSIAGWRFSQLGMPENVEQAMERVIRQPYGMFLVTGPTGSGKTTTLYAALNELNSPGKKIITVENPVEYRLERVNQVEVNPRIGLGFNDVLRAVLRQDPDIIMIGEIRDAESAHMAVRSALTGHLVLSTLHTNDAASALIRLMDLGIEPFLVESAILAVLSQRLVRKICPYCKAEDGSVPEALKEKIAKALKVAKEGLHFYKGKGCLNCNHTGYRGRQGIFELILIDKHMREAIESGDREAIREKAREQPQFQPLRLAALRLAAEGVTTLEEVARVTADVEWD